MDTVVATCASETKGRKRRHPTNLTNHGPFGGDISCTLCVCVLKRRDIVKSERESRVVRMAMAEFVAVDYVKC